MFISISRNWQDEPFILLLLIKDEKKILYNIRDKSKHIKRRIFFLRERKGDTSEKQKMQG
jgi:hypothetical protein